MPPTIGQSRNSVLRSTKLKPSVPSPQKIVPSPRKFTEDPLCDVQEPSERSPAILAVPRLNLLCSGPVVPFVPSFRRVCGPIGTVGVALEIHCRQLPRLHGSDVI